MKTFSTFCLVCLFGLSLIGQIVTISPAFPKRTEEITITYDAAQGNKGLVGVSPVYAHTGVIVEGKSGWQYVIGNWGTDDARVKMTSIGDNKHTLKLKINDFYKVPASEKITQLAFVFRNTNGTKEGKTANNQDIFIPFTENEGVLSANLISPAEKSFIINQGDKIPIKINASKSVKFSIYLNETLVHEATTTTLDYNLTPSPSTSTQKVRITVGEGQETLLYTFSFTTPPLLVKQEVPSGVRLGANVGDKLTFVLSAPDKKFVHLLTSINDWDIDNKYALNQSPDANTWWITVDKPADKTITYQYLVDGKVKIADPMSELVLDDNNDRFISPIPDQPNYPKDKTNGIVSILRLDKPNFDWTDQGFKKTNKERLNIYELLMRDFLSNKNYQTLIDTLDYLQRLGVNAIELMPIQEFEGNLSWGYNPSYHMALDKAYGSPDQFKAFVNEAHRRGIAVILDVVFNHAFSQSPLVQMYWDPTTNKPASNSPFANPDAKHPFNVGFDLNHESRFVQNWMDQVLEFWMKEYHVDGFRFDLSKGFTQKSSNDNNAFSAYDGTRVSILKRIADQIWKINKDAYVILEHFASNTEELELADYGMMLWANYGFNFNEATMGYVENNKSNVNNLDHRRRGWSKPHQISYMESHDEERLFYKNSQFGNTSGSYSVRDKDVALQRIEAAAQIFLAVPGPKMIWQFGELGYEYSINRCTNGTISDNCRLAEKPIRWDYLQDAQRQKLFKAYASMQQLRNKLSVFHTKNFTLDGADGYKVVILDGDTLDAVIVANLEMGTATKVINFPHSGKWYEYYSGTNIDIVGTSNQNISLDPGTYKLYFDKKIDINAITTSINGQELDQFFIYPNPSQDRIFIKSVNELNIQSVSIYNASGQQMNAYLESDNSVPTDHLPSGSYLIKIISDNGISTHRFLIP